VEIPNLLTTTEKVGQIIGFQLGLVRGRVVRRRLMLSEGRGKDVVTNPTAAEKWSPTQANAGTSNMTARETLAKADSAGVTVRVVHHGNGLAAAKGLLAGAVASKVHRIHHAARGHLDVLVEMVQSCAEILILGQGKPVVTWVIAVRKYRRRRCGECGGNKCVGRLSSDAGNRNCLRRRMSRRDRTLRSWRRRRRGRRRCCDYDWFDTRFRDERRSGAAAKRLVVEIGGRGGRFGCRTRRLG
jgi:antitoxin (DNA-binding transcriptional repressor) of toxin-antitoxin stability system